MSVCSDEIKEFWDYLEFYPEEDEEGYDGIHDGGIKGIKNNAPEPAKKQFAEYQKKQTEARKNNIKL